MIKYKDAVKAYKIVVLNQVQPTNGVVRQLVKTLIVYQGRGELDHSFEGVVSCLKQAGYEIGTKE